jgi:sugar phosphate isomerase/epimerase
MIRLGGPVFGGLPNPERWPGDPSDWARRVRELGYDAAYSPVDDPDDPRVDAFADAAEKADIVIAELGIWRNLIARSEPERRANVRRASALLDLADRLGARCAVTYAGTLGEGSYGTCDANFENDTFALIVDTVREIIDAVVPRRTTFALESMPSIVPDSPESYFELVAAVERPAFAVHFDPVNLIVSPRIHAQHRDLIRRFVGLLGERIVSCHAKDILLDPGPVSHLSEVAPGAGGLDYGVLFRELGRLPRDVPVMIEHLPQEAAYARAAAFLRSQLHGVQLTAAARG